MASSTISLRGFGRRKPGPWTQIDWSHPLARGLSGAWLLNEGGGSSTHDLLRGGHNGTLASSVAWKAGAYFGGTSLNFNGSDGQVTSGPPVTALPLTILAWFRTTQTADQALVYIGNPAATQGWVLLGLRSTGNTTCFSDDDSDKSAFADGPAYTVGAWQQAVGVFTSSASRQCYLNGQAGTLNTTSLGVTTLSGQALGVIGRSISQTWWLAGQLDHVLVWNRALSQGEIQQLYAQPFVLFRRPAPLGGLSFTQGGGQLTPPLPPVVQIPFGRVARVGTNPLVLRV